MFESPIKAQKSTKKYKKQTFFEKIVLQDNFLGISHHSPSVR